MKQSLSFTFALVFSLAVSGGVFFGGASSTSASVIDDVEVLISAGVVSQGNESLARDIARAFAWHNAPLASSSLVVSASQNIRYASGVYKKGEEIRGPLLMLENKGTTSLVYTLRMACPVAYRIFDTKDTLLYTNESERSCLLSREGKATLNPKGVVALPLTHKQSAFALPVGTYRFELTLPHYGTDSLTLTVVR